MMTVLYQSFKRKTDKILINENIRKSPKALWILELGHRHCDHHYSFGFVDDLSGVPKHERKIRYGREGLLWGGGKIQWKITSPSKCKCPFCRGLCYGNE